MGWFLTRESFNGGKKKKATAKRGAKSASPKWDPAQTVVGVQVCGWIALVVALVVGWRYMEKGVMDYAERNWSHEILAGDVYLAGVPGWMLDERGKPNWVAEEVKELVATAICPEGLPVPGPFDGGRLQEAAGLISDIAWVRDLKQIRRVKGGTIVVEADYREPVALVARADGYQAVDKEGYLLPMIMQSEQVDLYREWLPVISGVSWSNVRAGDRWEDAKVMAGIAVADRLRFEVGVAKQIASVDVSGADMYGRVKVVLETVNGGEVVWGRSPRDDQGIEVASDVKLQRLVELANNVQTGGLIDFDGQYVEITGPRITRGKGLGAPAKGEQQGGFRRVNNTY
ncbi:hypothetical protein KS4_01020 [Poriferisphaera corsica]|uniref:Cell division protein FtsQ/DivIB C-terminal domain-containing protein n=1 Tax=Poriferisphaera corsica TaxID=2528020 RepID=A0A517YPD1_9BACT|nr:cell division protein FtsQ/DivIB [Poriferisphaera corsica]QDU32073.1 hypothetical protein KS4_01020 [Poriferisphaera corsica]